MRQAVIDASVLCKLFAVEPERHVDEAVKLVEAGLNGSVGLVAPELLLLEVLNVATRRWRFTDAQVEIVARSLTDLPIDTHPVDIARAGSWTATGLSAYDSAYVAVAEDLGVTLYTDDAQIVELASEVARPISEYSSPG